MFRFGQAVRSSIADTCFREFKIAGHWKFMWYLTWLILETRRLVLYTAALEICNHDSIAVAVP
jgi:hypothetical protein